MDHRAFVDRLPADLKRDLQIRSNFKGLMQLALHLGLILTLATLVAHGGVLRWVFTLPLGVSIIFLFTLEHEATHKTPFASERLNEIAGHLAGFLILLPFTWFRYFHLAHHKYTHDPKRDPELLVGAKLETRWDYAKHVSGVPVWAGQVRKLFSNALGRKLEAHFPKSAISKIKWEARFYLAGYAIVLASLFWTDLVLWVWIVPLLLGQPLLRLYLLAEHGRCPHVANMLENTRTTYTTRFVRFLAWNMPFHAEHHTMPNVPFHALPRLHKEMASQLKSTSNGYSDFHSEYVGALKS